MEFRRVNKYITKFNYLFGFFYSDGMGNIYFNEILYGCMKKAFGVK